MKLKEVVFYKSVSINTKNVHFDDKKEIIFVGRSNVGKSSLMNNIFSKKDLVKTSSKPGKTRTANLFIVNKKFYFTDLPGYGFAKLGKELKEDLDSLISWYVEERKHYIKKVVLVVDSKIGPQEKDIEMFNYISELGLGIVIVLSKIDKLNSTSVSKSIKHTEKLFFGQQVIGVSSIKNSGTKELNRILFDSLTGL